MTSQFAAINSEGIALASDSAVTISGREQRSTFNRVNKIFPLGGEHQIAIMICGSPNYLPGNVSWNRIVGLFKNDLKKARLDSFDDYVDNFRRFLKNTTILNDPRQNNLAIQRCLGSWFASSCKAVEAYLAYQKGEAEIYGQLQLETVELEKSLQDAVEEFIQAMHKGATELTGLNSANSQWVAHIEKVSDEQMNNAEAVAERFVSLLNFKSGSESHNRLIELFNFHLAYTTFKSELVGPPKDDSYLHLSGIVIAGFGKKDLLPKMKEFSAGPTISKEDGALFLVREFEIRKTVDLDDTGEIKPTLNNKGVTEHTASAFLVPFAMKSEIQGVLNGIHEDVEGARWPHYPQKIRRLSAEMATAIEGGIIGDLSKTPGIGKLTVHKIEQAFKNGARGNLETFVRTRIDQALDREGILPRREKFRKVVRFLPLPELAAFARKMVEIEADIRHYVEPVRSVGGKIQVVTITKEEGFKILGDENR